jgi:phosphomannomutase/phosphoglucomutase
LNIFKACDIRGRYGSDLKEEDALAIGHAVGTTLAGKSVVAGGDVRPSTGPLKRELIKGLAESGCSVIDIGTVPTPAYYFAKDHLHADGGVMVTGSHNPPGDNGFKIILGSEAVTPGEIERLRKRVEEHDFTDGRGSIREENILQAYERFLLDAFTDLKGMKVVVDAGNGCYSAIAPGILRKLGCKVEELFCTPDGTFPNRSPNPTVPANLDALRETVKKTDSAAGIAYDGDGDRVVFADEKGRILESDICAVLFSRYFLGKHKGKKIVYDIKCSSILEEEIRKAGGVPVMEKSGHAFIRNTLMRESAVFGGEISGHFFFGELGRDDGLYATMLMLRIIAEEGQGLAELSDSVVRYPNTPDLRIPCPPGKAREIINALADAFKADRDAFISRIDGVRIAWPDGWMLARISVTEPLLTLRFEAHTEGRLAAIRQSVTDRVPQLGQLLK